MIPFVIPVAAVVYVYFFYLLRTFGRGVAGFMFSRLTGILIRVVRFLFRFVFGFVGLLPGFLVPAVGFMFRFACGVAGFVFWGVFAHLLASVVCYLVVLLMATYCSSSPECTCAFPPAATSVSGIMEYISSDPNLDICHLWCLVECALGV
jgi:hypothetical protein